MSFTEKYEETKGSFCVSDTKRDRNNRISSLNKTVISARYLGGDFGWVLRDKGCRFGADFLMDFGVREGCDLVRAWIGFSNYLEGWSVVVGN